MIKPASTRSSTKLTLSKSQLLLLAGVVAFAVAYVRPPALAEAAKPIPPPSAHVLAALKEAPSSSRNTETAVFAGGCFWGIQAVFQHTKGVLNAVSGYAGGQVKDADYERVSSGNTGHAEAVQVQFDPKQISYAQLLQIYFSVAHDPTQLNRQYPDVGTQYRSAVFVSGETQKQVAERYIAELDASGTYSSKIVTQVSLNQTFYPAEKYHQNYATLHPDAGYIARFDLPKIANLKALMPDWYREKPVLVDLL